MMLPVLFQGCSPSKNTAASRKYQAFITRYNIYFNGDEHYKETLKKLEEGYEDDFSSLLFMHPIEAKEHETSPQPSGDFTRSIEKAQKAIQLRTIKKRPKRKAGKGNDPEYKEWLKREEYNPFLHNAWMLMGRSQYMGGDFLGAASTFFYVSRHFKWLPVTVLEANLWQARSYCAIDWLFEAETILNRIDPQKDLVNNTLKEQYYFTYADWAIRSKDFDKGIEMLKEAIKYASGPQKTRMTFLLGQLYARTGQKRLAYQAFDKVGSTSSAPYRTKFNARIKQTEVFEGADIMPEVKALERMARYDRNKEYLDQVYYAIGNLYLSRGDTLKAIDNYNLAMKKSTRNGIDKAMAELTLGGLYYDLGRYTDAQPCYSEGVSLVPNTYPDYAIVKRRSDVLDELAVYAQNVEVQDSLLRLAAMTPEQRLAVVDKIIDELKKREKEEEEEARREQYLAEQAAKGTGLQQMGNAQQTNTFVLNTDNSWYFYNTATRNAGRTDFQKRWGSRKLEDDWRRRNKATFSLDSFGDEDSGDLASDDSDSGDGEQSDDESTKTQEELEHENDPHYPEYYLRQIPSDPTQIANSNEVIQEGLYNMGLILKDKLSDYSAARKEFLKLNERYPDNIYRLDVYYNLYMMAVRDNDAAMAEHWRQLIITDFPDSPYGQAMRNPDYFAGLRATYERQEGLYKQAYEAYMDNRNSDVHAAYRNMERDYPMSDLMPNFMFLDALTYVTENRPEEFSRVLSELLERYPQAQSAELASSYLRHIRSGRSIQSDGGNTRGMVWSTRLTADSTALANGETHLEFDLESDGPQTLVLLFPRNQVSANQLLYDVARHNFTSYMTRDFDLSQMEFGNLGLLIVSGFSNKAELDRYRRTLENSSDTPLPAQVIPVGISQANFDKLLKSGASFEQYFEAIGDHRLEETHRSVLPPDEYPSAEEIYTDSDTDGYESPATPDDELTSQAETEDVAAPVSDKVPGAKPAAKPAAPATPAVPATQAPDASKEAPATKTPATPSVTPSPVPAYPMGSEGDDDDEDIF